MMYYVLFNPYDENYDWEVKFKADDTLQFICACADKDTAEMIAKVLNDTGEK